MGQQSSTTARTGFITTRTVNPAEVQSLPCSSRKRSPSWTKWISGVTLAGLSLSLLVSGEAEAISITFEKIADTSTPIPGGTGNFEALGSPSLDKGNVAFSGYGDFDPDSFDYSQPGIYTYTDSELSVVADTNTPIPDGKSTFASFKGFSLDKGNVAFSGQSYGPTFAEDEGGIYTNIGGKLNVVADNPTFYEFISPSLDNGNVAFLLRIADDPDFKTSGVYTYIDGNLSVIADTSTPIPGSTDNFRDFYPPSLDNGSVVFGGLRGLGFEPFGEYENGIYISIDGNLSVVADFNTPIPGSTGNFESIGNFSLDNGNVVFDGAGNFDFTDGTSDGGIYKYTDGNKLSVVDNNTPIPGGTDNFGGFYSPSLDNGNVAFEGYDENLDQYGIYTNIGGSLIEVIAPGDLLDGKKVSSADFGREGLSGKQIAFSAYFDDGSQGVYIATVPEPSSVLGTLAFGTFGAGWMLKRRQKRQRASYTKGVE